MRSSFRIKSTGYTIHIGKDAFPSMQQFLTSGNPEGGPPVILTDTNTARFCLPVLQKRVPALSEAPVITIASGEKNKTIAETVRIWQELMNITASRNSILINLGGGVVMDMGGFAASTYKRGIRFIHVPTSLLGMIDASVGGKTGIDLDGYKNMVGTFTSPEAVYIDPVFLGTLEIRHKRAAFAEILKLGLVAGSTIWENLAASPLTFRLSQEITEDDMSKLLYDCLKIKNQIVKEDFREAGKRKILNFGHTVGHALESWSLANEKDPWLHGEAVAFGMLVAAILSFAHAGLSKEREDEILTVLIRDFPFRDFESYYVDDLIHRMRQDKKNADESIRFVLLDEIGTPLTDRVVEEKDIKLAMEQARKYILWWS